MRNRLEGVYANTSTNPIHINKRFSAHPASLIENAVGERCAGDGLGGDVACTVW